MKERDIKLSYSSGENFKNFFLDRENEAEKEGKS